MADFNITIGGDSTFNVSKTNETSTTCASIYTYEVEALDTEQIVITLTGDYDNAKYTLNGVQSTLVSPQTIVFNTSLKFSFSIENSGNPGVFYSCDINVTNNTTSETINSFDFLDERENDSAKCDSGDLSFDDLTDTPDSKVGQAGKYIKVSDDEIKLEYVDSVPGDANYVHDQTISSNSWVINHALGKYPSVIVQDNSGNTVFGDIVYTSISSITLNFTVAFAGKAYLN